MLVLYPQKDGATKLRNICFPPPTNLKTVPTAVCQFCE